MTTEDRLNNVLRMFKERGEYWHDRNKEKPSLPAATAMTAYNSAYMMLYCAMQGYDEELAQFDYYDKEN